jgi:hypothetical protein
MGEVPLIINGMTGSNYERLHKTANYNDIPKIYRGTPYLVRFLFLIRTTNCADTALPGASTSRSSSILNFKPPTKATAYFLGC